MKNIFEVGRPIHEIAMKNNLLPYVTQEIAARGWSDNTIIDDRMSKLLHAKQLANFEMLCEHGCS